MAALKVLDLVSDKEVAAGEVLGLERAVSKSKGVEFGSLMHQLGVDYLSNPFSPQVRETFLAIDPEAAERFPQRRQFRAEAPPAAEAAPTDAGAPPPPAAGRKKKTETAPAKPAAAEDKAAETGMAESRAAEPKPPESKKAVAATTKKAVESAAEPPVPEKQHDKPSKSEKVEKVEKHPKAEKQPEKVEKPEKRLAEATKVLPAADGLGKRKPR
jgi:endonuclease-3